MAKSTSRLFQSEEPKEMKEDAMNLPVVENELPEDGKSVDTTAEVVEKVEEPEVINIELSAIKKKRFCINGDKKKILELNTSDLNISSRLSSAYKRLTNYMEKVNKTLTEIPDDGELTDEQEELVRNRLAEIDAEMRNEIDFIFDAPVSDVCSDGGSMYDPFDGMFRFEHIIEAIAKLYENNLSSEFEKIRKRINVKTSKYTKKYHR